MKRLIRVTQHLADLMLFVVMAFALVTLSITVTHIKDVGQSVSIVMIVPETKHALEISVLIHVLVLVDKTLFAKLLITFQYVFAQKE